MVLACRQKDVKNVVKCGPPALGAGEPAGRLPAAGASDSVPPLRGGYVGGYKQMNIKESEFEWLRGYLQREESTQKHSMGEASELKNVMTHAAIRGGYGWAKL